MPPSSPSVSLTECLNLSATWRRTRTASRVTSVPMPSPGNTSMFRFKVVRFLNYLGRLGHWLHGMLLNQGEDLFIHQALLAMIGKRRELGVNQIQMFPGED